MSHYWVGGDFLQKPESFGGLHGKFRNQNFGVKVLLLTQESWALLSRAFRTIHQSCDWARQIQRLNARNLKCKLHESNTVQHSIWAEIPIFQGLGKGCRRRLPPKRKSTPWMRNQIYLLFNISVASNSTGISFEYIVGLSIALESFELTWNGLNWLRMRWTDFEWVELTPNGSNWLEMIWTSKHLKSNFWLVHWRLGLWVRLRLRLLLSLTLQSICLPSSSKECLSISLSSEVCWVPYLYEVLAVYIKFPCTRSPGVHMEL